MIDSAAKRAAALGFGRIAANTPSPDASLDAGDRALVMGGYALDALPRHFYALQQMAPSLGGGFVFGGDFDALLRVWGRRFDELEYAAMGLLDEMFPGTISELIGDWERVFAIVPAAGATLAERNAAVYAGWVACRGDLRISHFEAVARSLGYSIGATGAKHLRIVEGLYPPFCADFGRADVDAVYDQTAGVSAFTSVVFGSGVESDVQLQRIFNRLHTFGTEIVYRNE